MSKTDHEINRMSALPDLAHQRESLFRRLLPYLVISLLTILFNYPLILPGMGNVREGDFAIFYAPYRIYSSLQLHAGDLPFRTNAIFGGFPIWQDNQFALLYPINLLFALLVPNFAMERFIDLYMLVNITVLSIGSVFFIRSIGVSRLAAVAAACTISLGAFTVTHSQYLPMMQVQAMSLIAVGFLLRYFRTDATDHRLPLAAGIALAMGHIAGNPQPAVYFHYAIAVGVAALSLRLWRRTGSFRAGAKMASGGIAALVFGILLGAIHLLPSVHLISISARADVVRDAAVWTALGFPQLSMFLFPGFYQVLPWHFNWPPYAMDGSLTFTNLTEGFIPMGVFAAALGFLGWFHCRKSWLVQFLGWSSLFLVGCSLGDNLPFYGWIYDYVPGFKVLRVSTRILFLFYPAWALLVALGIDSLWSEPTRSVRSARWSAGLVVVMSVVMFVSVFGLNRGQWVTTWINSFVPDIKLRTNLEYMTLMKSQIMEGLAIQLYFGLFFLVTMLLLFTVRSAYARTRTALVLLLMGMELVLYGFGWNMAIQYPPMDTVESEEIKSFPGKVEGRAVIFDFTYGGPVNAALYSDVQLANGYGATIDKWVWFFMPQGSPPWTVPMQEIYCDLWNVSDISFPTRSVQAKVGGQPLTLSDWGWTSILKQPDPTSGQTVDLFRSIMPTTFTVELNTNQPVKSLHILGFSGDTGSLPDGTEIGRVTLRTAEPHEETSVPVVLGEDVSDLSYLDSGRIGTHSIANIAFRRHLPGNPSKELLVYDAELNVTTSASLKSIEFEATAPHPATFGVTHVIANLQDGTQIVRDASETAGFEKTESQRPLLYTMRRKNTPGFVRMMPNAVGGSYKEINYIHWRLFNGEIDPFETVIVDKRLLDDGELNELNATSPDTFQSTATITWKTDEHATINAEANQPGWVFLSYAYDEGWAATLNGEPATIYRASGPFMAIPVNAGKNTIVMSYVPKGLIPGAAISAFALIALLGAWFYVGRRRRVKRGRTEAHQPAILVNL